MKVNQSSIKDIWQKFVDIQEEIIRRRCSPIPVIPTSSKVDGDWITVTVDEKHREQQLDNILKGKLGVDSYDVDSDYILVDEKIWGSLSESQLEQICKDLSECYVHLEPTPTINAVISYRGQIKPNNLLTLEELHNLDSIFRERKLVEGEIDDKATFISKLSIDREAYLRYLFGDHCTTTERFDVKTNKSYVEVKIVYYNQYIPWEVLLQYAHVGLYCKYYKLSFKVCSLQARERLKFCFETYDSGEEAFVFSRRFTLKSPCHAAYVEEANENIRAFMNVAKLYCSEADVDINVEFVYGVSSRRILNTIFSEVKQYLRGKGEGYSLNTGTAMLGVDFNWRKENIADVLAGMKYDLPFVRVNIFENHRFKCKVNANIVGFEDLKNTLEDRYEGVSIENDRVNCQIKVSLPYVDTEYYEYKLLNLKKDLYSLSESGFDVEYSERIEGKVRLNIRHNKDSEQEDFEEHFLGVRNADFSVQVGVGQLKFGKLYKCSYPDLVFNLIADEESKDKIIKAFNAKAVSVITPILVGDLEKISRLRNAYSRAVSGDDLANPRLQRFIFDSAGATPIKDIDSLLNKNGFVYNDVCNHLLNKKINESQKNAIIKALYAEDLAVIQGPPGTGKSTAIAEMIWQQVRRGFMPGNKPERILLTSETNLAVDNAISRIINDRTNLVKPVRFGYEEKLESEGLQFSPAAMSHWVRTGDPHYVEVEEDGTSGRECDNLVLINWLKNISLRSFRQQGKDVIIGEDVVSKWRSCLEKPNEKIRKIVYDKYIQNVNVVAATCGSIGSKRADGKGYTSFFKDYCNTFRLPPEKSKIEFTTVIQDETSKATPAELVLPLVYGRRAIVIGDQRQLPPILDKEEFEETLEYAVKVADAEDEKYEIQELRNFVSKHFEEMEVSHFQRLYENIDDSLKGTFNLQYRMHPHINEVIEQFYHEDGGLYCGLVRPVDLGVDDPDMSNPASRYHGIEISGLIRKETHVLFIDTDSPEMIDGTSRVNYGEVETIDNLMTSFDMSESFQNFLLNFKNEEDKQIGIISFYGKQIKKLREVASRHPALPTRVSTVDRFQGMERNVVIVSMVRSNTIQSRKDQKPNWEHYPDFGYPSQLSLGFAQSPNRLNVALSRAKRLLIIVGNRTLFSSLEIYKNLFSTIEANKSNIVVKQQDVCVRSMKL